MQHRVRAVALGGVLLSLLRPVPAWCLASDRDQPIQLQADSVEIDDRQGISVYRGNVRMTQGSMNLTADVATVYHPKRKLEKAVAQGNPVRYQQQLDNQRGQVHARAARMEYQATQQTLLLSGGAHVWQDGNEFSGSRIEYDLKTDVVRASRDAAGKERVQVTIQPASRRKP